MPSDLNGRPSPPGSASGVPGHRRRRDLGQHFLRDEAVLAAILAAADLRPGQRVLEVGPGPGNLTARLAAAVGPAGQLVAVEADAALADALAGRWANVRVVTGDAVRADLAALGRFDRIVANLPYLISGPITAAFLDLLARPESAWGLAVLMYQREFAERLLAGPGTRAYGRLTVHAARRVAVERVRAVPPGAFDPPPQVDSLVVRLVPHPAPPFEVGDDGLWRAVVDGTFQQRRKKLRNTLPAAAAALGVPAEESLRALAEAGVADRRPEELAPAAFAALAVDLARRRPGG